jgi:hypothetical protein
MNGRTLTPAATMNQSSVPTKPRIDRRVYILKERKTTAAAADATQIATIRGALDSESMVTEVRSLGCGSSCGSQVNRSVGKIKSSADRGVKDLASYL